MADADQPAAVGSDQPVERSTAKTLDTVVNATVSAIFGVYLFDVLTDGAVRRAAGPYVLLGRQKMHELAAHTRDRRRLRWELWTATERLIEIGETPIDLDRRESA